MVKRYRWQASILALAVMGVSACGSDEVAPNPPPIGTPSPSPPPTLTLAFDFADNAAGWESGFAEYGTNQDEDDFEFESGLANVPANVNEQGFLMQSHNRSDDVLMYLSSAVSGLEPSRSYRVEATLSFATNVPTGCFGIGGSPGDSVYIKAGANNEPVERSVENFSGFPSYAVNIDHGNQSQSGNEAIVIGTYAQSMPTGGNCTSSNPYSIKVLSTEGEGPIVTADSEGRLYPFFASDSGFEGVTRMYWLEGEFSFVPIE
ncbi:MAG: hypothetical protein AAFR64_10710 [Pseudomonadota bacterium]